LTDAFDISAVKGLKDKDAKAILVKDGYNELPSSKPRSILNIAFDVVREPMFLLLVAAGAIYLILGDVREALMLLSFVFVVMGITLYQERKTERVLEALRDLSSPRALVIRDGRQKRIPGREVVNGDMLVLSEGDRVPADSILLDTMGLQVDESLLTGESMPVSKKTGTLDDCMLRPGGDSLPCLYSGTLIVKGQGIAVVKAIGIDTEIGKIGKELKRITPEPTTLQVETGKIVKRLALLGITLCIIVIIVYGITRDDWLQGFLAGLTLAMATLPEEFSVVLTIFLALGAWRISRSNVLTRRIPAIETLGAATVLCVDKTGTITQNLMSVKTLTVGRDVFDLDKEQKSIPESFHEIVEFAILASQRDPFDPMEKAIKSLGESHLNNTEHLHKDWKLVREYPLSEELLALSHVWKSPHGSDYVIAAKGAPEAIADLCHFSNDRIRELESSIEGLADEGLRVIGVAKAHFSEPEFPGKQHDFTFEFLGLVGLSDPVKPLVHEAVKECNSAGVRVIMITGDYPGTARRIAEEIGLPWQDKIITGAELDMMTDEELLERISDVSIFARVLPEQKLRIVEALKHKDEVVAMTGDGVNDAPALRSAHIGIAMGGRGTDVAREAADLVLLDDDFSSIVAAVRLGRRIFDNLKKAMAYIFAVHVPIAGLSLIPVILGWPLVLMPVHIVFLELIIDPACSIIFEAEPEEENVMSRPPRNQADPLFGARTVLLSLLQGTSVLIIVMAIFSIAYMRGQGVADARALTFASLIVANLGLILTNRSWSRTIIGTIGTKNNALWWIIGGAVVFLALTIYTPFLRGLFHFTTLHPVDILISIAAGGIGILWFEILKVLNRKRKGSKG
jgi:Ca2+-transporting ATPase